MGVFDGITDFDPGPGMTVLTPIGDYDLFTLKFSQSPLSIENALNDFGPSLKAYPNPTSGILTVELGQNYKEVTVHITTLTDQLMDGQKFNSVDQFKIEISGPAGMYFAKIQTTEGKSAMVKIIKK